MYLFDQIHESWYPAFNLSRKLHDELEKLYEEEYVEPAKEYLFAPFSVPIDSVKCVTLFQDPYPNGEGIGYAVAYNEEFKKPKSFRIIEKEFGSELSPSLQEWKDVGVLSANAAMTVKHGLPNSHREKWIRFTSKWIDYLDKRQEVTFLLFGRVAQSFNNNIVANRSRLFYAPHPATRHHNFIGCGIFKNYEPFQSINL